MKSQTKATDTLFKLKQGEKSGQILAWRIKQLQTERIKTMTL